MRITMILAAVERVLEGRDLRPSNIKEGITATSRLQGYMGGQFYYDDGQVQGGWLLTYFHQKIAASG